MLSLFSPDRTYAFTLKSAYRLVLLILILGRSCLRRDFESGSRVTPLFAC